MLKSPLLARIFIPLASIIIVSLTVWNISLVHKRIKADERTKMKLLFNAIQSVNKESESPDLGLSLLILESNTYIPAIIVDDKGEIVFRKNLPKNMEKDSIALYSYLEKLKVGNKPLTLDLKGTTQTLYYGNSQLLTKIKYYPIILLVIIVLFVSVLYFFFRTSKESEKNKLWAGMAKETAHQIGTPLSSLVGWLEILKEEKKVAPDYIAEIEKDIDRLHTITDRFSKVGSHIKLVKTDIAQASLDTFDYLQKRSSKLIDFSIDIPEQKTYVMLNKPLFSWTIENLVKNAIDAMKGKGNIRVEVKSSKSWVKIWIQDNGKGIGSKNYKRVFEPGYTTKTRGWGLGLSLAKRIIEEYHKGKINVLYSEVGKGTTFQIKMKIVK